MILHSDPKEVEATDWQYASKKILWEERRWSIATVFLRYGRWDSPRKVSSLLLLKESVNNTCETQTQQASRKDKKTMII